MGEADILTTLRAMGLTLTADGGSIRAEPKAELTDEARALIRAYKPELLALLTQSAADERVDDSLPDPAAEARRGRVIALLEDNPHIRLAVVTDLDADLEVVILTVGIRGQGTVDLAIPWERFDGLNVLEIVERYGAAQEVAP